MLKQSITSIVLATTMLATPAIALANTQQSVTTSPDYELITGDTASYKFPEGQKITAYPSIKVGVPLNAGDYHLKSIPRTQMSKNDPDHTYLLELTDQGTTKVNEALSNMPNEYERVDSSANVTGLFEIPAPTNTSDKDTNPTKVFKTGELPNATGGEPTVTDVMYVTTLTSHATNVSSTKSFDDLKTQSNRQQKEIQSKIGKLSDAQQKFITPGSSTLSVKKSDIDTNTDAKTLKKSSKTKIVNLQAYNMTKNAQAVDKARNNTTSKNNTLHNIVVGTAVAGVVFGVISIVTVAILNKKKHQNK